MIKTVRFLSLLLLVVALFLCSSEALAKTDEPGKAQKTKVMEAYGKLPLYFIQNDGQADERVKFYEKGSGHATFFTKEGVYLSLRKGEQPSASSHQPEIENSKLKTQNSELVRLIPLNANKNPEIVAEEKLSGKVNYFTGNDPKKWRTDIPTYTKVRYKEVYPDIDMVFYGKQRQLEYDVVVKPGADPSIAAFEYEGVKELKVNKDGELIALLPSGKELIQKRPYIYQEIDGRRVEIQGRYAAYEKDGRHLFRFDVSDYNPQYALVIDPVLSYSTYLGGSSDDYGYGIAVDSSGNAYVTGYTFSTDFPTENPYRGSNAGNSDAFVTKLSPLGNSLIYSTYLGGSDYDSGYGIAVDSSGNAYVTGGASSTNFPTKNPYQGWKAGNTDAFITKLSPSGNSLIYSTYLGGNIADYGRGIAVDSSGSAYVTGTTYSSNFPTMNPYQGWKAGNTDTFVTKLSSSGNSLIYSTYLGGSGEDYGRGIAVDSSGNAYVTGETWSPNFPTENPYQGSYAGNSEAFITKLSPEGNSLIHSTYLGGSSNDYGRGIAVDSAGSAYVTGYTNSNNFPTENSYDSTCGIVGDCSIYDDAFVTKLSPEGNALIYSTYLGGSGWDYGFGIAVDSSGNAYVVGRTNSTDFPTENPYQGSYAGGNDAFVTKLSPSGESLIYSTYLGGSNWDFGNGIAVDSSGSAYLTGETESTDFPTQNPYQGSFTGGNTDAFVTKLSDLPDLIVSSLAAGIRTYGTPMVKGVFANYMVMNQGSGDAVSSCLDFYLSRDAVIDPGDVYLGRENIPGLAAGNSYGSFKGFRLSSDKWQPASGTWRVIADADACGDNAESDETNNQTSTVAGIAAK